MEAELCTRLVVDTTHNEEVIREASALALASALAENPDYVPAVLQQLMEVYEDKLYVRRQIPWKWQRGEACTFTLCGTFSHWLWELVLEVICVELYADATTSAGLIWTRHIGSSS